MGHQTFASKCKKCGQTIIKTRVQYLHWTRDIISTNCKCDERDKRQRQARYLKQSHKL